MTDSILLGQTEDGDKITIDINKLIESRMVIQGSSGSGKSGLVRVICEKVAKRVPVIVLDREGDFATLREKVDLVLVGAKGDVPTDVRSAAILARKLVEMKVSAVIDLYDLKVPAQREYVRLFCEALINLPKELYHPLLIVIDEAQLFCPEKGSSGRDITSTQAVIDLIAQGRKRGFSTLLATQRFSKVHNDALAELKNVFIGSTWLDVDQKRAADYLGLTGNDKRELREVPKRTFYCFGPALSVQGVSKIYVETAETTFPKPGEIHRLELPKASEAITHILDQLDDLPEVAEQEKRDVASLRTENADLKRQLSERPTVPDPVEVEKMVEVPIMSPDTIKAAEGLADTLSQKLIDVVSDLNIHLGDLEHVRDEFIAGVAKVKGVELPVGIETRVDRNWMYEEISRMPMPSERRPRGLASHVSDDAAAIYIPQSNTSRREAPAPEPVGDFKPSNYQLELLRGLAELEALNINTPTRVQLGFFTAKKISSGHFQSMVSSLKTNGFLTYPSEGCLQLTDRGRGWVAGGVFPPTSLDALHDRVRKTLNNYQQKIFNAVVSVYPDSMTREDMATVIDGNMGSGHFQSMVSSLKTAGLLGYPGQGLLRAEDLLFPASLK